MSMFKLFISIVPHGKGEKLTRAAMESGCQGGTVLMGRGLAKSNLAAILGLGETTKDLIMMVVEKSVSETVKEAIVHTASRERRNFGELFSVGVDFLLKAGNIFQNEESNSTNSKNNANSPDSNNLEEDTMNTQNEMITVIVNKGYADDVMATARKAGAGGGTVINARGTAKETDERFFGMHIVSEKEMLIIVVPSEKKNGVISAIKELKCLKDPGMGITYSSKVEDFSLLGKSK